MSTPNIHIFDNDLDPRETNEPHAFVTTVEADVHGFVMTAFEVRNVNCFVIYSTGLNLALRAVSRRTDHLPLIHHTRFVKIACPWRSLISLACRI